MEGKNEGTGELGAAPDSLVPSNLSKKVSSSNYQYSKKSKMAKEYNLEKRTLEFAKNVRDFIKRLPKGLINIEYSKQLVRSSGSVGANCIEANECFSKKDRCLRFKISRKEAKESGYWLTLIESAEQQKQEELRTEAKELTMIFTSIIKKLI